MLALHGKLRVEGTAPDGDTMHFLPTTPELIHELHDTDRVKHPDDLSLRFEGIDAPETHYRPPGGHEEEAQPLANPARDHLLDAAGFVIERRDDHDSQKIVDATPDTQPAVVLSTHGDIYGRLVSYVIVDDDGDLPEDGAWTPVDEALLGRTLNAEQLRSGSAYLTLYSSCPPAQRAFLRELAASARKQRTGVWADDHTSEFVLDDEASIGPHGELILPKLFRRATEYLLSRADGETLPGWLAAHGPDPHHAAHDDKVIVRGLTVHLSTLLDQRRDVVSLAADELDLVFVDRK